MNNKKKVNSIQNVFIEHLLCAKYFLKFLLGELKKRNKIKYFTYFIPSWLQRALCLYTAFIQFYYS